MGLGRGLAEPHHEEREGPNGGQILFDVDAFFECVGNADIARRAIDRRAADLVHDEGVLGPIGGATDLAATGANRLDAAGQPGCRRVSRVDLDRRAAKAVVAPGRVGDLHRDAIFKFGTVQGRLEPGNGFVEVFAGAQFADQRKLALAGNGDVAAALDLGDEDARRADKAVFRPLRQRLAVPPDRRQDRMGGFQSVNAIFRGAEIGRFSGDADIGDEEPDLGGVDIELRRLDVNREIGPGNLAAVDPLHQILGAGAHAGAGFTAFLVADEREGHIALQRHTRPVQQAQGTEGGADATLQVTGAPPPDLAVDQGGRKRIFPRLALPVLRPAAHMDRVGMADEHQGGAAAAAGARAPDVRATREEIARTGVEAEFGHGLLQEPCKVRLVPGHALAADCLAQQINVGVFVLNGLEPGFQFARCHLAAS